jgi:hypothetical protein
MTGHTPGPWKACPARFGRQFVRQDPVNWDGMGYQHICTLPQSPKGSHYGELFAANARLIAAAPDMLAALLKILEASDNDLWVSAEVAVHRIEAALVDCREAVAKAADSATGDRVRSINAKALS